MPLTCPRCDAVLTKGVERNDIDIWACPNNHGLGMTLSEAWGHLQDDEVKAIWRAAKDAEGALKKPLSRKDMVQIDITVDSDEEAGNRGSDAHEMQLDVNVEDQFIWFDVGELAQLPDDLPNPKLTDEQRRQLQKVAEQVGDMMTDSWRKRESATLTGRLYDFVASHQRLRGAIEDALPGKTFPDET